MRYPFLGALLLPVILLCGGGAHAASLDAIAKRLAPHKAVYDIDLVATHSGSQIINVSGKMTYEWKKSCDAWVTDHHFTLNYDYADSEGMRINSDFSTYESLDGTSFDYTSRRKRDGELYEDLRGHADMSPKGGKATFTNSETAPYDLNPGSLFPMGHSIRLIDHAMAGDKFYLAEVFDGSDEDGPIEINSFIGKIADTKKLAKNDKIDAKMVNGKAWNVRMAVFPLKDKEEKADYEMSLVFHENGIISDMLIEYDDFSVTQKLVSLESIPAETCGGQDNVLSKP